ncbi:hypothetical protein EMIHUDRAFT_235799 [Emiliania huxleyi CCMP1516]|uniref:Uncharacterized protein n=2 Tax=Emiliania huxleyi TaxID=2903 RepID=A0A0D3JVB8_EMIH1|nr:hypothetical protein EMIHUDRAFT_235799 [Emiliania huxleyi CCMP1516]EOD27453.1 hypothetical protein EMIHUDRAFT_235799 [Emiliania huxleyi CCMP1516]|eukprot:XP_005779882.1 hypothetical protein EMIHUDRAFT_235799 [Emiliania huxleyi CCMP1516]
MLAPLGYHMNRQCDDVLKRAVDGSWIVFDVTTCVVERNFGMAVAPGGESSIRLYLSGPLDEGGNSLVIGSHSWLAWYFFEKEGVLNYYGFKRPRGRRSRNGHEYEGPFAYSGL